MKKARELSLVFLQIIDFQYGLTDNPVSILPRSNYGVVEVKMAYYQPLTSVFKNLG